MRRGKGSRKFIFRKMIYFKIGRNIIYIGKNTAQKGNNSLVLLMI